jgi:hypothetical protein
MKAAIVKVLPKAELGLNQVEIREAVLPFLPDDLFPGGGDCSVVGEDSATGSRGQGGGDSGIYQAHPLASSLDFDRLHHLRRRQPR